MNTMQPWMSADEIALIEHYLQPHFTMLEWGAGGSTVHFSHQVQEYHSIEHSLEWVEKIQAELESTHRTNTSLYHVESNLPRSFPTKPEEFADYIAYPAIINKKFDAVLIDGRARQFCAKFVLPYLKPNAKVFIHDFFSPRRSRYKIVLQDYDIINFSTTGEQTLVILQKKSAWNYAKKCIQTLLH